MRAYELNCLTHIPGQRIWAHARFGAKTDLIVVEVPDHLPMWDVTNRAMEAEFDFLPARSRQSDQVPTVTYKQLLDAKHGGEHTIHLKPKIGRPSKAGVARDQRIDLWLSGEEKFYFEAMGGVARVHSDIERRRQENPYNGMQKPSKDAGMLDDPEEFAALRRLVLMHVPEAERDVFWHEFMKLSQESGFKGD